MRKNHDFKWAWIIIVNSIWGSLFNYFKGQNTRLNNDYEKIFLIRHAKSSCKENVIDHERVLNTRGLNDVQLVSKSLIGQLKPDLILCSDAVRTRLKANAFVKNHQFSDEIFELSPNLYDISGSNLLEVIKKCPKYFNELMFFFA